MNEIQDGSGNVFEDLGFASEEAAELKIKSDLAFVINGIIKHRHLTQSEAKELLGATQADVSRLANGKIAGFTIERLFRYLRRLDRDFIITVKKKPNSRSQAIAQVRA